MEERITTAGILVLDGRFLIAKRIDSGSIGDGSLSVARTGWARVRRRR